MANEKAALEGRRICLVTSGPVGSNPRLVKEANALTEAGARVTVVSLDVTGLAHVQRRNESVLSGAAWTSMEVRRGPWLGHRARAAAHKAARRLARLGLAPFPLQVHALHRYSLDLGRMAASIPADLYIAHNLGALPAAFRAAVRNGAKLGFDAEDFHFGELPEDPVHEPQRRLIRAVEGRCLARCAYITAASSGIAQAYAGLYSVPEPRVILNVFPLDQAPATWTPRGTAAPGPSLYWFSQTIGPDRGLEDAVRALGISAIRPHLYLRGNVSEDYRCQLLQMASEHGAAGLLHFLDPADPREMARLAASYDAGLAIEPMATPNSRAALSNKVFTYLLAGIPTLASATPGQTELATRTGDTVKLSPPGDAEGLAAAITAILSDPDALSALRKQSWELGQQTFNWERERGRFIAIVASALGPGTGPEGP